MRLGSIIRVKPECLERYKELHANPWPEVNRTIQECQRTARESMAGGQPYHPGMPYQQLFNLL